MPSMNDFDLHPEDGALGGNFTLLGRKMANTIGEAIDKMQEAERQPSDISDWTQEAPNDPVNHPKHYTHYKDIEVIQLTRQMNFNRGNAVKYIARAGLKDPSKEIEDLEKAAFYIKDEIKRLKDL